MAKLAQRTTSRQRQVRSNVIPFPLKHQNIAALTQQQAELAERGLICTMDVSTDVLSALSIFNGDKIIVQTCFSQRELDDAELCIVSILGGSRVGAKLTFGRGFVDVDTFEPEMPVKRYKPVEIDIVGIVIGSQWSFANRRFN